MKARRIAHDIWWVGAMDWDRKLFDALIPLPDGTSYNSYFVKGNQKSALIDAVDPTMKKALLARLADLSVSTIDYVVVNHVEQDHSGTVPDILEAFPMAKALVSDKGKAFMIDMLHVPEERIVVVQNGETLDLGGRMLQFIYFPWVHWPETMITWLPQEKILFPCDLFGAHLAGDLATDDPTILLPAAKRYYAEIMMPFRNIIGRNLDIVDKLGPTMIAPSHGPIHNRPTLIMDAYREWTGAHPKNLVAVPYISMHDSTRLMVEHLVESLAERGVIAEQFNLADPDIGKLAMSLVDAAGIVLGSPMVLGGPHPKVAYAAMLANALQPKATFASIIGSYGWGGKLAEKLQALVQNLKVEFLPPVLVKGLPRSKDYFALDELADAIATRVLASGTGSVATSTSAPQKFFCPVCRYVYDPALGDPDGGIPPDTPFEKIPDTWVCPVCRVPKNMLRPVAAASAAASTR